MEDPEVGMEIAHSPGFADRFFKVLSEFPESAEAWRNPDVRGADL